MTSHLKFKSLELVNRDGPHPVLMVGNYTTNTRPRLSTLKNKFKEIEAAIPGMFDKIQNPNATSVSDEDYELFFVEFPLNPAGVLVEIDDQTALCRVFMDIKENSKQTNFRGEYSFIDQAKYDELERVGDFKAMTETANDQTKDADTSTCGVSRKRHRVDDSIDESSGTASTSRKHDLQFELPAKDTDITQLDKANDMVQAAITKQDNTYAEMEKLRSVYEIYRNTTAEEINGLKNTIKEISAVAGEKDRMIDMLKFQLESLTNAFGSRMDKLQTTITSQYNDAKLQSAQHTNDIETKIDQVRTAVISRAEGTGRQIAGLEDSLTTALDSHWETMVAEMERVMQEKGACEQHIMEQYQQAIVKANSYAQTKKGVFTRKLNQVKKAFAAKIRKLEMELMVETRLRQCVIDNFFELIPTSTTPT